MAGDGVREGSQDGSRRRGRQRSTDGTADGSVERRRVRQRTDGTQDGTQDGTTAAPEMVYERRWAGVHIGDRGGVWHVRNMWLEPSGVPNVWVICEDFHYLIWKGKVPSVISQFPRQHAFFMKIDCMKCDYVMNLSMCAKPNFTGNPKAIPIWHPLQIKWCKEWVRVVHPL